VGAYIRLARDCAAPAAPAGYRASPVAPPLPTGPPANIFPLKAIAPSPRPDHLPYAGPSSVGCNVS
jgi:hypothetical protein